MLVAFLMFAVVGAANLVPPDREPRPSEWGYRPPDGSRVSVNPPSLTWVHDRDAIGYIVQWATKPDFSNAVTVETR